MNWEKEGGKSAFLPFKWAYSGRKRPFSDVLLEAKTWGVVVGAGGKAVLEDNERADRHLGEELDEGCREGLRATCRRPAAFESPSRAVLGPGEAV